MISDHLRCFQELRMSARMCNLEWMETDTEAEVMDDEEVDE